MDSGHSIGRADCPPLPPHGFGLCKTLALSPRVPAKHQENKGLVPTRVHSPESHQMVTVSVHGRWGAGTPSWFPRWERKLVGPLATECCELPTGCQRSHSLLCRLLLATGLPGLLGTACQIWRITEEAATKCGDRVQLCLLDTCDMANVTPKILVLFHFNQKFNLNSCSVLAGALDSVSLINGLNGILAGGLFGSWGNGRVCVYVCVSICLGSNPSSADRLLRVSHSSFPFCKKKRPTGPI